MVSAISSCVLSPAGHLNSTPTVKEVKMGTGTNNAEQPPVPSHEDRSRDPAVKAQATYNHIVRIYGLILSFELYTLTSKMRMQIQQNGTSSCMIQQSIRQTSASSRSQATPSFCLRANKRDEYKQALVLYAVRIGSIVLPHPDLCSLPHSCYHLLCCVIVQPSLLVLHFQ